eukprot:CAMPEP_0198198470 /NCGR_PEP_ID=MMETSP1445-20131203/1930_1 /TAXON_ID=36898 /ORGANISM="Pyramimonas sp., Strain CCMP2087" /LENGTH=236 /DNA_ID=CAMNT_0043868043 /DNA_START=244 /DNA_END=954 /DNA_ORIENTATION=+
MAEYTIQFPTIENLEAGQWSPDGTGLGHHQEIGFAERKAAGRNTAVAMTKALAAATAAGYNEKLVNATVKEGGKKGIEISGAADMGGLEFFCTQVAQPAGRLDLLTLTMHAMNKEIDPEEEESKGGSGEVGKLLLSDGMKDFLMLAYVPQDKTAKVNAVEWVQFVVAELGFGAIVGESDDGWCAAMCPCDPEKGHFAIKIKDEALKAGIKFLKSKGAFPDKEEEDDDECYSGEFEW